jgi:hypothetical protein
MIEGHPRSLPIGPRARPALRHLPLAAEARDVDRAWRPIYAVLELTLKCDRACAHEVELVPRLAVNSRQAHVVDGSNEPGDGSHLPSSIRQTENGSQSDPPTPSRLEVGLPHHT